MSDGEQTIDGYTIINEIATGNTTEILEVSDGQGGTQPLCMKLLLPEALKQPEARQVLKHEGKVGKSLNHPGIVKIHKVAVTKKHGYIVMDYFRAPNLKTQLMNDRPAFHSRFRKVFESLCLALGHMHEKGWVHKDIKPENILANKAGELRLIDFSLSVRGAGGLGKLLGGSKIVQGTRTYVAPETLLKKAPTNQTDMYSLGITVFELLTGNPPFRGMSPNELLRMHMQEPAPPVSAVNPNVTQEMDRLVARLLSKKPADRHKSMEEVYAEFRSLKIFKEDPLEIESRRQEDHKRAELDIEAASERISSRRDHKRSELGMHEPPAAKTPKPQPLIPPDAKPTPPQSPPVGQPMAGQGGAPQGMPPNMPYPQPPPGYGYPPGYPMSQSPFPGGYPPGYSPQPGSAPFPPQQAPSPQQPAAAPPPSKPQPPESAPVKKEKPKPEKNAEEDDLPLMDMDDLPDVL